MKPSFDELLAEFQLALRDCRNLYIDAGRHCATEHPELLPGTPQEFVQLMDDLHRALLVKTYVSIAEADRSWCVEERRLARELVLHVWGKLLDGGQLKETLIRLSNQAENLKWYAMLRPFGEIEPLRDRIGHLETIVNRFANIVAKADGKLCESEARVLHSLQEEMDRHLKRIPYADVDHQTAQRHGTKAVADLKAGAQALRKEYQLANHAKPAPAVEAPRVSVEVAKAELDKLIGLDEIKQEVDSLINYLLLQRNRVEAGLPETQLSLHSILTGNPGTGKTTVARIVGNVLGAMGILKKGHVIETDRSGLVAEFAGQTGPKTNKKIDEALDGILFIDEAYSLVAEGSEDPYGHEAIQALLKRMEDDRDRLVVVLAGYPLPIDRLLDSNPGLRSRFSRRIHFNDYKPSDLGRILQRMCDANHYQLPPETRAKFIVAVHWLYERRDEHFGNGRLARNVFEDAVRQLANRVADITPITKQLLTEIIADDVIVPLVPSETLLNLEDRRFRVACPGCQKNSVIPTRYLSKQVACPCGKKFRTDWGDCI